MGPLKTSTVTTEAASEARILMDRAYEALDMLAFVAQAVAMKGDLLATEDAQAGLYNILDRCIYDLREVTDAYRLTGAGNDGGEVYQP